REGSGCARAGCGRRSALPRAIRCSRKHRSGTARGRKYTRRAMAHRGDEEVIAADERRLAGLGYKQELRRGMGAFSNYALSLSIICILAGGVTSFHQGLSSVG